MSNNIKCPECRNVGDFAKNDNGEIYCLHCGLVIYSPYPYCAGFRFKTLTDILNERRR